MQMVNFKKDIGIGDLRRFVRMGHALFTLKSEKTGQHYTYRITRIEKSNNAGSNLVWGKVRKGNKIINDWKPSPACYLYFISFLHSGEKYEYLGVFNQFDFSIRLTGKSKVTADAPVYKAIDYFLNLLKIVAPADVNSAFKNPEDYEKWAQGCDDFLARKYQEYAPYLTIYHANKCCCCGRELTEPESVELGIGPICRTGDWY